MLWAVRTTASQSASSQFGGMDGSFFFSFLPDHHSLFFFFFSGTLAGTKFRQEDTIQGTKFRQEDTIQGTKSDKETCRSGSHSGCGTFVNSIGKRSGCLAQIDHSPAQMNLKQQGACPRTGPLPRVRRPSIREEIWLSGPVHQPPGSTGAQSCPPQEAELGPTA